MAAAVDRVSNQISDKFGVSGEESREIAEQALFARSLGGELGLSIPLSQSIGSLGMGSKVNAGGALKGEKLDKESAGIRANRHEAYDEAFNAFSDQEAREAWSLQEQARSTEQAKQAKTTGTGERESASAGTAKESQHQQGLRDLASKFESLSTQMSQAEGSTATLNQDQTAALVQYISRQSGKPESQVATQIGDAVKFHLMDRSGIAGKTVAEWAQEWYDRSRPNGEGISEKAAPLKGSVPNRIQAEQTALSSQQGEIGASVQTQQGIIHTDLKKEQSQTITRRQGVESHVAQAREGVTAAIASKEQDGADKRAGIDQTGGDIKGRVGGLQSGALSLFQTVKKGLLGDRLSESREKIFGDPLPHPNFYWEQRMRRGGKQGPEP
jgi:hypothetical protein